MNSFQTYALALVAFLFAFLFAPPEAAADDSGGWNNSAQTQPVNASVSGTGIHGDKSVTFKNSKGSTTVKATPDPNGGGLDIEESAVGTVFEYDEEGKITGSTSYRFKNGRAWYRLHDQTTWRKLHQDPKTDKTLHVNGDDTIGALPDEENKPWLMLEAANALEITPDT